MKSLPQGRKRRVHTRTIFATHQIKEFTCTIFLFFTWHFQTCDLCLSWTFYHEQPILVHFWKSVSTLCQTRVHSIRLACEKSSLAAACQHSAEITHRKTLIFFISSYTQPWEIFTLETVFVVAFSMFSRKTEHSLRSRKLNCMRPSLPRRRFASKRHWELKEPI